MAKVIDTVADCKLLFNSPVKNESALILLRSRLRAITQRMGFPERKQENMLLVASEMVSNQLKHAAGCGLIQLWQQPGPVLDMLALDYGPGIANLERAQRDGYSSVNTLGKGLGSISRLSDDSYIYTQPANASGVKKWNGAVFLARFYPPNTVFEGLMPPKFEVVYILFLAKVLRQASALFKICVIRVICGLSPRSAMSPSPIGFRVFEAMLCPRVAVNSSAATKKEVAPH